MRRSDSRVPRRASRTHLRSSLGQWTCVRVFSGTDPADPPVLGRAAPIRPPRSEPRTSATSRVRSRSRSRSPRRRSRPLARTRTPPSARLSPSRRRSRSGRAPSRTAMARRPPPSDSEPAPPPRRTPLDRLLEAAAPIFLQYPNRSSRSILHRVPSNRRRQIHPGRA
ncbi:skin secretory protein xP2 [Iris pallida]|uniref:Skin secretory protein xP2 n=1 Tax=Iris pallida TaxID=29817 RepID=A0AAX6HAI0_IRIPA|nr:skin secretory protein xP2 [Iris pallida]